MSDPKTAALASTKIRNALGVGCGLAFLVTLAALFVLADRNERLFLALEYRSPRYELGKDIPADIKGFEIYVDKAELDRIHLERRILPLLLVVSGASAFGLGDRKIAARQPRRP